MKRRSGRADLTLRINRTELCSTPPRRAGGDQFVAELGSAGLGGRSYVSVDIDERAPEWIVLDYAEGGHERVWGRAHSGTEGVLTYILVEDDSSTGYVSASNARQHLRCDDS